MKNGFLSALFCAGLTVGASAVEWASVAKDDLGKEGAQPYLVTAEGKAVFEVETPTTPEEMRTVAYGNVVRLSYTALNASDQYRLVLHFLSDSSTRKQEVWLNGVKQAELTLPARQVRPLTIEVPPELSNRGELTLEIRKTQGVSAVLSLAELFSTGTQRPEPLADVSAEFIEKDYPVPRLSPLPLDPSALLSLDGEWQFVPRFDKKLLHSLEEAEWDKISVPGQWALQGFDVPKGQAAAYARSVTLPVAWKGKRIKLRFDAVYSEARVYFNGTLVGSHFGGFTPFELDVSALARFDQSNELVLSVKNESLADTMASGSRYAAHPLGGIPRSVFVVALPEVNLSSLGVVTTFDKNYRDAHLKVTTHLCNESQLAQRGLKLVYTLAKWPEGESQPLAGVEDIALTAGETKPFVAETLVAAPDQWNSETPHLYALTATLWQEGEVLEQVTERFGFRQIEVRGNQVFVNNYPVKLRGVNRHEVHPLTGRSLAKEWYKKDVALFGQANVNLIRTAHYPPDKALMEAADEFGMFIECEGPFCWSFRNLNKNSKTVETAVVQSLEMVEYFKNHPSILYWSVANESHWIPAFRAADRQIRALDPTRPTTFNWHPGPLQQREDDCEVGSIHYPGYALAPYADYDRPVSCGEFAHLNAYNRYELATDVALRERWGAYFHRQWEMMYAAKGILGGSLWAGIDDTFYWDARTAQGTTEERTVGYGTWGPLDGWRRKKPEWWSLKKVFSPLKVSLEEVGERYITLQVENRQDFSRSQRLELRWTLGAQSRVLETDLAPKESGTVRLERSAGSAGASELTVEVHDPRGFLVDTYRFALNELTGPTEAGATPPQPVLYEVRQEPDHLVVDGADSTYRINRKTGLIETAEARGPRLMILPLRSDGVTRMEGKTQDYDPYNPLCQGWVAHSVEVLTDSLDSSPVIRVEGAYQEAKGYYQYAFLPSGRVKVEYYFTALEEVNPRQIGVVFESLAPVTKLSWKRKGYWSTYPDWHIARLSGEARRGEGIKVGPVGPRTHPSHEWRHDRGTSGSHDFASTKHHISFGAIDFKNGQQLTVWGKEKRHLRAWEEGEQVKLLIASYSNGGAERFLRVLARGEERPLKVGDQIVGDAVLEQSVSAD